MNTISAQATSGHPTAPTPWASGNQQQQQQQQQPAWPLQSQAATSFNFPQALPIRIDTQAECLPMHQGGGSRAVATIILNTSGRDSKSKSRRRDSMDIDGEESESEPEGGHGLDKRTTKMLKKMVKREVQRQLEKAFNKEFKRQFKAHMAQYVWEMDDRFEEAGGVAAASSASSSSSSSADAAPSRPHRPSTRRPLHNPAMRGGGPVSDLGGGGRVFEMSPSPPPRSTPVVPLSAASSGSSFTPDSPPPPARFSRGGSGRFATPGFGGGQGRASCGTSQAESLRQGTCSDGHQWRGGRFSAPNSDQRPGYSGRPVSPRGAAGIFGLSGGGGGGESSWTYRERDDVDMSDD